MGVADVGTGIIYSFVFVALFPARAGRYVGLDRGLTPALGRWGYPLQGGYQKSLAGRVRGVQVRLVAVTGEDGRLTPNP